MEFVNKWIKRIVDNWVVALLLIDVVGSLVMCIIMLFTHNWISAALYGLICLGIVIWYIYSLYMNLKAVGEVFAMIFGAAFGIFIPGFRFRNH